MSVCSSGVASLGGTLWLGCHPAPAPPEARLSPYDQDFVCLWRCAPLVTQHCPPSGWAPLPLARQPFWGQMPPFYVTEDIRRYWKCVNNLIQNYKYANTLYLLYIILSNVLYNVQAHCIDIIFSGLFWKVITIIFFKRTRTPIKTIVLVSLLGYIQ